MVKICFVNLRRSGVVGLPSAESCSPGNSSLSPHSLSPAEDVSHAPPSLPASPVPPSLSPLWEHKIKCVCTALLTSNVTEGFTYTPLELLLNQPKPSRKTRKNSQENSSIRNGGNFGRSSSMRDPDLQRWLVTQRCRPEAKHSHVSRVEEVSSQVSRVQEVSSYLNGTLITSSSVVYKCKPEYQKYVQMHID